MTCHWINTLYLFEVSLVVCWTFRTLWTSAVMPSAPIFSLPAAPLRYTVALRVINLLLDVRGCPHQNITPSSHARQPARPKLLFVTALCRDGGYIMPAEEGEAWRSAVQCRAYNLHLSPCNAQHNRRARLLVRLLNGQKSKKGNLDKMHCWETEVDICSGCNGSIQRGGSWWSSSNWIFPGDANSQCDHTAWISCTGACITTLHHQRRPILNWKLQKKDHAEVTTNNHSNISLCFGFKKRRRK